MIEGFYTAVENNGMFLVKKHFVKQFGALSRLFRTLQFFYRTVKNEEINTFFSDPHVWSTLRRPCPYPLKTAAEAATA